MEEPKIPLNCHHLGSLLDLACFIVIGHYSQSFLFVLSFLLQPCYCLVPPRLHHLQSAIIVEA